MVIEYVEVISYLKVFFTFLINDERFVSDIFDTLLLGVVTLHRGSSLHGILHPVECSRGGIFPCDDYDTPLSSIQMVHSSGSVINKFYVDDLGDVDSSKLRNLSNVTKCCL
jgi:hypothetical protein